MVSRKQLNKLVAALQFVIIATLILRLFFAYEWLNSGKGKAIELVNDREAYVSRMEPVISKTWTEGTQTVKPNPYPFVVSFLKNVAGPNANIFLSLTATTEILIGISYLLGFLVRPAAIVGMFLNLVFYLSLGHTSAATAGINIMMFGGQLFLFLVSAGRAYGIDAILNKRLKNQIVF